jgi:hypothetical protein
VERVLADIDADHGDRGIGCLRHGALFVFGAPCQLSLLAGQEHGRTIPLRDMGNIQLTCILKPVSARVKKHQRITSQSADAFEAG